MKHMTVRLRKYVLAFSAFQSLAVLLHLEKSMVLLATKQASQRRPRSPDLIKDLIPDQRGSLLVYGEEDSQYFVKRLQL